MRIYIALMGVLILTFFLYLPGLTGGFMHDDFVNIVDNPAIQVETLDTKSLKQIFIERGTSSPGIFSRPVAQFSFMLNVVLQGMNPYWFKLVNVFIHLVTGVLIYYSVLLLCRSLSLTRPEFHLSGRELQSQWVAVFTAALWLMHPLHVSTVLYSVQRMAQLSTLFTLSAFALYLVIRIRQIQRQNDSNRSLLLIAVLILWPLGMFSKENAVILPVLCLVSEITIFRFSCVSAELKLLHGLLIAVVLLVIGYFLLKPDFILSTYSFRDFTLPQRLMTECRILWDYVGRLLLPRISHMGLYNDDIPISLSLLEPLSTLISVFGWLAVFLSAVIAPRKHTVFSFAVLWFLAGHLIESSVFGLELSYEHRNYLPSVGVMFAIAYGGVHLISSQQALRKILMLSSFGVLVLFSLLTGLRSTQWSSESGRIAMEAQNHPRSHRANSDLVGLLFTNREYLKAAEVVKQVEKSERVFADVYFSKLSLEHVLKGQVDEALYKEIDHQFRQMPVFVSIINKLYSYIGDAAANQWESAEQLIGMTKALMSNPYLSDRKSQGHLHLVLAKVHHDTGEMALFEEHANAAYTLFPENSAITDAYDYMLSRANNRDTGSKAVDL